MPNISLAFDVLELPFTKHDAASGSHNVIRKQVVVHGTFVVDRWPGFLVSSSSGIQNTCAGLYRGKLLAILVDVHKRINLG
jgi:hypothetical protein